METRDKEGKLHSFNGKPARITGRGTNKYWYRHGKYHRSKDLPAIIQGDDYKEWYKDGKKHRIGDKPSLIYDGNKYWYKNGKKHRGNNKPAVIENDGNKEWFKEGVRYYPGNEKLTSRDKKEIVRLYQIGEIDKMILREFLGKKDEVSKILEETKKKLKRYNFG